MKKEIVKIEETQLKKQLDHNAQPKEQIFQQKNQYQTQKPNSITELTQNKSQSKKKLNHKEKGIFNRQPLFQIMHKILSGAQIYNQDFIKLNRVDILFVYFFIMRKGNMCQNFQDQILQETDSITKKIIIFNKIIKQHQFSKSSQQNLQFLVKLAFKYMRQQLIDDKLIKHHFCYDQFYKYYFQKVSEQEKIDINQFCDPRQRNNPQKLFTTYNIQYILLLLSSQKFKEDFYEFLNNKIFLYYLNISKNKIQILVDKVEKKQSIF